PPQKDVHPIDAFLDVKIDRAGLTKSPPADARTLLRRITLDLTGLPPEQGELAAFEKALQEDRRAAVKALVERLLASPHHGEKFARHWLDVARYADSNGS